MNHPRPWLRYVGADALSAADIVNFDDTNVDDPAGERLGEVDGFIVDVNSGRPCHVVVNRSGWFQSKLFLVPVEHVALDRAANRMRADVPSERVRRYPGFDRRQFEELSEDELWHLDSRR